ncbi:hypothetical protein Taro_015312 [Colocasia esculenta]|uniref:Uncharacterized protein n=1 Tax=Colocasia esculenta TaxID=4460 RepID=A0A843UB46_COLES|nr:hypothetical protein [Colocasia esculenta]
MALAGNRHDWHIIRRPLDGHDWRGGLPLGKCAQYFDNDRHARNIILYFEQHARSRGFLLLLTLSAPQMFAPAPLNGGGYGGYNGRLYGQWRRDGYEGEDLLRFGCQWCWRNGRCNDWCNGGWRLNNGGFNGNGW